MDSALFVKLTYGKIPGPGRCKEVYEGICTEVLWVKLRDKVIVKKLFAVGLDKEVRYHATIAPQSQEVSHLFVVNPSGRI